MATKKNQKKKPPKIHSFLACRDYSSSLDDEEKWNAFYRCYFAPLGVVAINSIPKGANVYQLTGIDREILLANGRRILVDEKKRSVDYGDCLLEEWSAYRGKDHPDNKIGWAVDPGKHCDFVAYAITAPAFSVRMIPFVPLVRAMVRNLPRWRHGEGGAQYPKDARNKTYKTRNVAVPWPELERALAESSALAMAGELFVEPGSDLEAVPF